ASEGSAAAPDATDDAGAGAWVEAGGGAWVDAGAGATGSPAALTVSVPRVGINARQSEDNRRNFDDIVQGTAGLGTGMEADAGTGPRPLLAGRPRRTRSRIPQTCSTPSSRRGVARDSQSAFTP